MDDDASHRVLLSKVAGGAGPDRATVKDDVVWADVEILSQVQVYRLYVFVECPISGEAAIAFTEASVLIDDAVDIDLLQKVGLKPSLHEVNVLSVAVRQNDRVLCIAIDEEDWDDDPEDFEDAE